MQRTKKILPFSNGRDTDDSNSPQISDVISEGHRGNIGHLLSLPLKPKGYYVCSEGGCTDSIDGKCFERQEIEAKFRGLKTISETTTQVPGEKVTDKDINDMIDEFKRGSFGMEFLFKFTLTNEKDPPGACWIDNQKNPRVMAVLHKGSNILDYYSLPECRKMDRSYFEKIKNPEEDGTKIVIEPPRHPYEMPGLTHIGTQALPFIQKSLKEQAVTNRISLHRLEITIAECLGDILEGRAVRLNRELFRSLINLLKDTDTQLNPDTENSEVLVQIINKLLKGSPYQLVIMKEQRKAA